MQAFLLFAVILFVTNKATAADQNDAPTEGRCSEFMDELFLRTVRRPELDPHKYEDKAYEFNFDWLFLRISVKAEIHDVTMEGQSKGKRIGDCKITEKDNEDVYVATMQFHDIKVNGKMTVTHSSTFIDETSKTVSVSSTPQIVKVTVTVAVPKDGSCPVLRKVTYSQTSKLEIKSGPFGVFKFLRDKCMEYVIRFFSPIFKGTKDTKLYDALKEEARNMGDQRECKSSFR